MLGQRNILYHAIAIVTVVIWGTTFVSTKILINIGLSPAEIMLYRFVLAYFCMLPFAYKKLWANSFKDEFLMLLAGISGGSLYFVAENTALGITLASNVSLLVCTIPIITSVLSYLLYKESLKKRFMFGSLVALAGVGMVVFNGSVLLKISPLGDFLTMVASVSWAFYCILLKRLSARYSIKFITRKVFFYGVLSLLPYFLFVPLEIDVELLKLPVVYLNLLFLGCIASMLCFLMWNTAVRFLGAAKTANYIYVVPLVTLLTSAAFLSETLTWVSLTGALAIIGGVYIAEKQNIIKDEK